MKIIAEMLFSDCCDVGVKVTVNEGILCFICLKCDKVCDIKKREYF